MDERTRQLLVVVMGGIVIWCISAGLALVPFKIRRARSLGCAFWLAAGIGACGRCVVYALVWGFRNDLARLVPQVPLIVIALFCGMLGGFMNVVIKDMYGNWYLGVLKRRKARRLKDGGANSR